MNAACYRAEVEQLQKGITDLQRRAALLSRGIPMLAGSALSIAYQAWCLVEEKILTMQRQHLHACISYHRALEREARASGERC